MYSHQCLEENSNHNPSIRSNTIFSNIGNRTSVVVNTVLPR